VLRSLRRTHLGAFVSAATLASVLSLSVASWFHSETDDADFAPLAVVHDHAAHHLVAATAAAGTPDHCFVCHWTSLRTVPTVVALHAPTAESRGLTGIFWTDPRGATFATQPARAPPVA